MDDMEWVGYSHPESNNLWLNVQLKMGGVPQELYWDTDFIHDTGIEGTLTRSINSTKLSGVGDTPEGRDVIQNLENTRNVPWEPHEVRQGQAQVVAPGLGQSLGSVQAGV